MEREHLSGHARRLASAIELESSDYHGFIATNAQACEFLRKFAGENSAFVQIAVNAMGDGIPEGPEKVARALESFAAYTDAGLLNEISPERKAQLDVVSDLLEQAQSLIDAGGVHPAAPAMLIGATLEEFLRTWIEFRNLPLGNRKRGLDTYAQVLREANLINKQDAKDITAWAGLRNHAAHGEWEQIGAKANVSLMLQGVNLFMRTYQSGNAV
jgi:hypothetical protein